MKKDQMTAILDTMYLKSRKLSTCNVAIEKSATNFLHMPCHPSFKWSLIGTQPYGFICELSMPVRK